MIDSYPAGATGTAHKERGAASSIARWMGLAAAPTFAIMALLTSMLDQRDSICTITQGAFPLSGMLTMYLLMGAFHSAPWVKLIFGR
jgi:hypothetical protein